MNKSPRVLKKNVSTRSHWKDYLTDKNMLLSLITYKLTFMVVGFFLQTKWVLLQTEKKPRSIKVLKGKYMYLSLTCLRFPFIFEKESRYH